MFDERLVLNCLGTDLDPPRGIVHGGLAIALLGCAMAVRASRAAGDKLGITMRYETYFQRKIQAPRGILCRAWLDKRVADVKKDEDGIRGG